MICHATAPYNLCHAVAPYSLCHAVAPYNLCHADAPYNICHADAPYNLCHADAPYNLSRKRIMQSMSRWRISYNQTIHHSVQLSTIDISQIINKDTINRFFTHLCPNKRVNWYVAYCQQRRRRLLITKEASLHYIMNLCMVPLTTEDRRAPTRSKWFIYPSESVFFFIKKN